MARHSLLLFNEGGESLTSPKATTLKRGFQNALYIAGLLNVRSSSSIFLPPSLPPPPSRRFWVFVVHINLVNLSFAHANCLRNSLMPWQRKPPINLSGSEWEGKEREEKRKRKKKKHKKTHTRETATTNVKQTEAPIHFLCACCFCFYDTVHKSPCVVSESAQVISQNST